MAQALRRGLLSKEIKRQEDVIKVVNQFYVGSFYRFYNIWRDGGKTMKDSGFVRKELEEYVLKNVSKVLDLSKQTLGGEQTAVVSNPMQVGGKAGGFADF